MNISKILWLVTALSWLAPNDGLADQEIILKRPTKKQLSIVRQILKQEKNSLYSGFNKNDEDAFTLKDIEVAEVNLDRNPIPEVVMRVNNAAYDGSAGYGFAIWEKKDNYWNEIGGSDFGTKHVIIVTDRIINGYKIYRVLTDPYDRIYRGSTYNCDGCPP